MYRHQYCKLTELGLECRRTLGDSFPADEVLKLMQALFSEWTLFTWLVGFSKGSKLLCVLWTLTFLSSGIVSRGLITESIPWQFRVDIFVTHIWKEKTAFIDFNRLSLYRSMYQTASKKAPAFTGIHFLLKYWNHICILHREHKLTVRTINTCLYSVLKDPEKDKTEEKHT